MMNDRVYCPSDSVCRILTVTPMSPKTKKFRHSRVGETLFSTLEECLGLAVVAGYLVKNGTGPYEVLLLYIDRAKSDPCWEKRLSEETWTHDAQHDRIRNVLFRVLEEYNLDLPIEKAYDEKTGALISDTCFNISLVDFDYWQKYWRKGDDR